MGEAQILKMPDTPPHNFEAEMALLGAIMSKNTLLDRIEFLEPEHFADARHGRIFAACRHLYRESKAADPITLKDHFQADGCLDEIGGVGYLTKLVSNVVTIINGPDYARTIFDRFQAR